MDDILLFADLHIHNHKKSMQRLHDCLAVLEWIFQTAQQHHITNLIFAGDLFHDRQKIDLITYNLTFEIFSKYCQGNINVYLLLGNHDLWYYDKWDISSVRPFSALPKVTVINKPVSLEINNCLIDFLPFTHDPVEHLKQLNNKILIAHLAVHGAKLNNYAYADVVVEHDGEMVKIDSNLFKKYDCVFLGHYHAHQQIDNIEYIGSPLELNFGEAYQQKHIIIFNLKTNNKTYIKNEFSPKHLVVNEETIKNIDIKSNFIKLTTQESITELIELKRTLNKLNPGSLEIIQIKTETNVDIQSLLYKDQELKAKYIEQAKTNLNKEKLLEIGEQIETIKV